MKKKIILRAILGFPIGVAIGHIITILLSLIWGNGHYSPCVPDLMLFIGNEVLAVFLQALLCGLLGAGFAACSVIWELEHWSILRQTGLYFLLTSLIMLPIAYLLHWMEHSLLGLLQYTAIFILIFAAIWLWQFFLGRNSIRQINARLSADRNSNETRNHP